MTAPRDTPELISVDWGTTSLRLYLVGRGGGVLDRRESAQGITRVARDEFAGILRAACADWLARHGALPAILSGMVGSRQGWVEAPYVHCPAGLAELASSAIALPVEGFGPVRLIAGVDSRDSLGIPDVMRGEECQIVGALATMALDGGNFILPGTHSKWVRVDGGRIVSFRTFMTGEVFAALSSHTILGRMMAQDGPPSAAAFERGVATAARSAGAGEWLHRLFSVRTLGLMGELPDGEARDYLSGLTIGWELASLTDAAAAITARDRVVLVGNPELSRRYREAARYLGLETAAAPADCVCAGHWRLAQAAGWIDTASGAST